MLNNNFDFMKSINNQIYNDITYAQSIINSNPIDAINKIYISLENITKDILKEHKIYKKNFTQKKIIKYLRFDREILDLKTYSLFETIRNTYESIHNNIGNNIDAEWANLCLEYMYMICRWYAYEYYNIKPGDMNPKPQNPKTEVIININQKVKNQLNYIPHYTAKEAYKALAMDINDEYDVLLFLSSINLLNSYVKQDGIILFIRPKYVFKDILVERLEEIITKDIDSVEVYYNRETTYIKVFNLQFSFKYLSSNEFLKIYSSSIRNKVQEWEGIKLQPQSEHIFNQAIELHKKVKNHMYI